MYVFEISKFVHNTHIIIFNQVTEAEITVHKELLNLSSHMHHFSAKEFFFISYTHKKTKHTMKENQYETWCSQDVFAQIVKQLMQYRYKAPQLESLILTYYQPGISNFKVHKVIANNKKTLNVAFFAQTQFGHPYCILSENTPANMK